MQEINNIQKGKQKSKFTKTFSRDKYLYLLLLPGILYFIVFRYLPMYGIVIAFKDYNMFAGLSKSPWVGLMWFKRLFEAPAFAQVFQNTLLISTYKLLWGFPAPIILALLLNELRNIRFKKFIQTVLYLPHFISWVIMASIIVIFLNPVDGVVNIILNSFKIQSINFLMTKDMFRSLLVITDMYKEVGWGTIIYIAAISGVSPELYEAAMMDGAKKFQQIWFITLPAIKSVISILFILSLGNILNAGFEQIFLLYNPLVLDVGDVIDTFVYRKGIVEVNYSLATAAGLFKSVIALILIVLANRIVKHFDEEGLW